MTRQRWAVLPAPLAGALALVLSLTGVLLGAAPSAAAASSKTAQVHQLRATAAPTSTSRVGTARTGAPAAVIRAGQAEPRTVAASPSGGAVSPGQVILRPAHLVARRLPRPSDNTPLDTNIGTRSDRAPPRTAGT